MQDTPNRIPTPWPLLARRVRYQLVPVFTLLISTALAGWLWYRRGGSVTAIGSVNAIQVPVNAKIDGLLVELPRKVQIFDSVAAGEVLARLDSSQIEAQIARTTSELNEVRRQLDLIKKMRGGKGPTTAPTTLPTAIPPKKDVATPGIGAAAIAARDSLNPIDTASIEPADVNLLIQNEFTLQMLANAHMAKIQDLEQRILAQDIKAPISGFIIAINKFPGQAVTAGQAILTIAAEKGDYIVTYVRQSQYIQPTPGMVVNVHLRSAPRTIQSHVTSVGPQLELIPDIHLRDPRMPEWGLPVHVAIPPQTNLRPGELVDLFFLRPKQPNGT